MIRPNARSGAWRPWPCWPWGRLAEGKTLVDGFPADCTARCDAYRAFLYEMSGDYPRSDAIRAKLAHGNPTPYVFDLWGRERLRHGDNDGAIAVFREGVGHGAWFADTWQGWGEALLNKGDAAGAIPKFVEAQKAAPRWARLHLKWGEALAKLGRADEAKAQFKAAATMDLTASEKVELAGQKM